MKNRNLIFNSLLESLKNNHSGLSVGLLSGKSGLLILFAHLNNLFPEKYSETLGDIVNSLFDSIQNEKNSFTMSGGISGISYAINSYQCLEGFNSKTDILHDIDEYIFKSLLLEMKNYNWDPLHGFIGQGLYFIHRHKYVDKTLQLTKIIEVLYNSRVEYKSYKIWITPDNQLHSNDNFNFGMAHGMSGIVSFISLVAQQGIEKERCREMVHSCLSFFEFFSRKIDEKYLFPSIVDVKKTVDDGDGRLAWCYGDLCIANAFFQAAKGFDNIKWFNKGKKIALHTTKITFKESGIIDPMICHGSSGVILQYYRYFKLTGIQEFQEAMNYHLKCMIDNFYKKDKGIGGFQYRVFEGKKYKKKNESGLLEGSAGIALVLLTLEYDLKDWDLFLMTNV